MKVRIASREDAKKIATLIRELSSPFLLSPSGEGAEPFLASINEAEIERYVSSSNFAYFVAEHEGQLAGVVALRDNSHVFHLFVAQRLQRMGFGRALWQLVEAAASRGGNPGRFTVNSSLNAVPVYERFGFGISAPAVQVHGIGYQPMLLQRQAHGT